jgi:hypothetical protein
MRLAALLLAALGGACATEPLPPPYDTYGDPYAPYPYWSLYDDPFFWPGYWGDDWAGYCTYCGPWFGPYYGYYTTYTWYPGRYSGHRGPGWGRPPLGGRYPPPPPSGRPGGGALGGPHQPTRPMPRPHPMPHWPLAPPLVRPCRPGGPLCYKGAPATPRLS